MSSRASHQRQIAACESPTQEEAQQTIEQLHRENQKLREELELYTQENALLNEVISTVGSTLRLDEVLHHLVDTVVRATACQVAFIYLYDQDKERLVLASASKQYQHLVGKLSMALGEGIAGWVALHRQPVFLKDEALHDPRFRYFPELEEEKYQSIMTVPIISKDRQLIGAITVQAIAPHEFTDQHRTFISNTAALVGGALENARLYENTQRKLRILTSLSVLSQTISSGVYLDDILRSLATLTVQILEVDLCVIMLMEPGSGREREIEVPRRLTVRATAPNLNERAHFRSIDVDRHFLEQLREINERSQHARAAQNNRTIEINEDTLRRLNPFQDSQSSYRTLLSAPLIAGTEQLGLINCYSSRSRRFTPEDQTLLTTIANQAAIAIKNSYLVNQLTQKDIVKAFFDDLTQGTAEPEDSLRQRAHFLGCDLSKPHAAVMIEITHIEDYQERTASLKTRSDAQRQASAGTLAETNGNGYTQSTQLQGIYKRISGVVRRRILDNYGGSVCHEHENMITCIIPLGKDLAGARLKSWLEDLARHMYDEYNVSLSIGIGNTCRTISDYRRGFAEANEALRMGENLQQEHDSSAQHALVTHFNDLGVYRYLYKIAHMDDLRDVYQEQIARIDNYDRRKNTDLLDTLETYLECAGNLTRTSDRLFVHRNTLIQRLERLQSLCDIDIQDRGNWLTLQVAIKVYKLRQHHA
ncbi:MAG: GAF domain-containing protein [Ktedonobacteraceae bacterium]|nr:GAF domain-containing protein [Ktedonobacteraceae bacterium]